MALTFAKILHLAQLSRIALVLTALSNSWLVIFLSSSGLDPSPGMLSRYPLGVSLLLGGLAAVGLHTYGIALNDVLDARHDRLFSPQRPIPAGRVGATGGIVLAICNLIVAIAASTFLGHVAVLICLATAGAILFYDAAGKFVPAIGIVVLGLIRAGNMFIPNAALGFTFPVWLTMSHVLICAAVAYRIAGKRPALTHRDGWWITAAWAFWTLLLVGWMSWRDTLMLTDAPHAWWGPVIASGMFIIFARWLLRPAVRQRHSHRTVGTLFMQHSLLWLIAYDASWLLASGEVAFGLVHLLLLGLAYAAVGAERWTLGLKLDPDTPRRREPRTFMRGFSVRRPRGVRLGR